MSDLGGFSPLIGGKFALARTVRASRSDDAGEEHPLADIKVSDLHSGPGISLQKSRDRSTGVEQDAVAHAPDSRTSLASAAHLSALGRFKSALAGLRDSLAKLDTALFQSPETPDMPLTVRSVESLVTAYNQVLEIGQALDGRRWVSPFVEEDAMEASVRRPPFIMGNEGDLASVTGLKIPPAPSFPKRGTERLTVEAIGESALDLLAPPTPLSQGEQGVLLLAPLDSPANRPLPVPQKEGEATESPRAGQSRKSAPMTAEMMSEKAGFPPDGGEIVESSVPSPSFFPTPPPALVEERSRESEDSHRSTASRVVVGIRIQDDGALQLDSSKLQVALTENPQAVATVLFAPVRRVATALDRLDQDTQITRVMVVRPSHPQPSLEGNRESLPYPSFIAKPLGGGPSGDFIPVNAPVLPAASGILSGQAAIDQRDHSDSTSIESSLILTDPVVHHAGGASSVAASVRGGGSLLESASQQPDSLTDERLGDDGALEFRAERSERPIQRSGDQRQGLVDHLDALEARYRSQLMAMDRLMDRLATTDQWLTQRQARLFNNL